MGDVHWSSVTFLAGFEDSAPNDESELGQTITYHGTGARSATVAAYGSKSLYVPSDGDGATVPNDASFFSGTDSFTIEATVYFSEGFSANGQYAIMSHWDTTLSITGWSFWYNYADVGFDSRLRFAISDSTGSYTLVISHDVDLAQDTHYHLAIDFDGTDYRLYIDGSMVAKTTDSHSIGTHTSLLGIGCYVDNGAVWNGDRLAGYIDEARITSGVARYASDSGFTAPVAAYERGPDYSISETIEIDESFATLGITSIIEAIDVSEAASVLFPVEMAEAFSAYALVAPRHVRFDTLTETVNLTEVLATIPGVLLHEYLTVTDTPAPQFVYMRTVADIMELVGALSASMPVTLNESVSMTLAQIAKLSIGVIDELDLNDTLLPAMFYGKTVSEGIELSDTLAMFLSGLISESLTVAPTLTPLHTMRPTLSESVNVSESVSPAFILRVVTTDAIEVTASEALTMLYTQTVSENIDVAGAYLSPGDGFTSWAMNTRTGAVSEYTNYEFNSFVTTGNKKVLGASSSGLYELTGETDDGTDIVSTLRSGFMQWTGTHLGRFKAVYIATRGADDFVLKLETGDGLEYNYAVTTRSMRTTKVHLGKGLRARYFAFELISSGADFDLESLEFVPLVAQRRV